MFYKLVAICMSVLLLLASCTSHDRDNRFDKNGVSYDPSASNDGEILNSGVKSLYKAASSSCDTACLTTLGTALVTVVIVVLEVVAEILKFVFLSKPSAPEVAISIPDIDLPSLPSVPDISDYTDNISDYYKALKKIDASSAAKILDLDVDVREYRIAVTDIATLPSAAILDSMAKMDFTALRDVGDSLRTVLQNSGAKALQSDKASKYVAAYLDTLDIPTDTLVTMMLSDSAALTAYLWSDSSFRAGMGSIVETELAASDAPMLWIVFRQMYSDLRVGLEPVQSTLVPAFITRYSQLPVAAMEYEDVSKECVTNTLKALALSMALSEKAAKNNESQAPQALREFFAKYRARYQSQ